MKEEQHIDNSKSVLQKIATIYADRLLSDITLQVGSQQFPAHRLILCASSDVFQVMLMNSSWSESKERTVVLKEDPACVSVFAEFLKYLYTGKLNMNYEVVLPLLALADKYNVGDLMRLCLDYMLNHVVSASLSNQLISWLQYTKNSGHEAASSACSNFMSWNFCLIAGSHEFKNMDKETLIRFLNSSELIVQEEMVLFNYLIDWLMAQETRIILINEDIDFNKIAHEVLSHIRFPMMTPNQVTNLLFHPLIQRFKEFILERLAIAMAFHSNCLDQTKVPFLNESPSNRYLFVPRLFTAERWCATLTIDNYHQFPTFGVRTLLFSTPSSASDHDSERMHEWSVDFYPKGVTFGKFYLIVWHGMIELPEHVTKCVRLSIMSKSVWPGQENRVNIAVLLLATQDGVEYVHNVVNRQAIFSHSQKVVNLDNLVPYQVLNSNDVQSPYFVGPQYDTVKLKIIITPNS